ncbi:MAG: sulfatase/phosphatase domain-containing protein [Phycisphaerales bacterium]
MRTSALKRWIILTCVFLLSLGSHVAESAATSSDSPRPNILFIFTDDHATHAISSYGSVMNETPNIDRIAREGMRFENCFVTNSICAPSRAVILTGMHSHHNGVITNAESFDGSQRTFPKLLREAGYETAIMGKWHLKSDPTGFDFWEVLIGQGPYYNPPLKTAAGVVQHEGYTTEIITDRALEWLDERDDDRPFMLMVQHKAPHRNWQPAPEHLHLYDSVDIPEPATLFDAYEGRASGAKHQEMTIAEHMYPSDLKLTPPGNLTPEQLEVWNAAYEPKNEAFRAANLEGDDLVRWKYQRYIKDYLRSIRSVDDHVGRILDYLDESGLAENTIVIYSSDQGFYLGDHGWYDKRWMYEESLRMPFLVRWPGQIAPNSTNEDLVQNLDFAPTFLDVAGAEIPGDLQGRSLAPLMRGDTPADWRESIYYHYYEYPAVHMVPRHYGVRTESHKLIHYYQINEWELFDLERDPDELRSVHDDPDYASIRRRLESELSRLQEKYGETTPQASLDAIRQRAAIRRAESVELHLAYEFDERNPASKPDLDPSLKPFTIAARVTPAEPDGVVVAQGGEVYGYSLYLLDGVPHFGVRSDGAWREVAAPQAISTGASVALTGVLDRASQFHLFVNGVRVATAPGQFITNRPAEGFDLRTDDGTVVGEYPAAFEFDGAIEELRIYWGEWPEQDLLEWAQGVEL